MKKTFYLLSFITISLLVSCNNKINENFKFQNLRNDEVFNTAEKDTLLYYFFYEKYGYFPENLTQAKLKIFDFDYEITIDGGNLDSTQYISQTNEQILNNAILLHKKYLKFNKWKEYNKRNIDSALIVKIPEFYINSNGTLGIMYEVRNRTNEFITKFKGDIIIYDDYGDARYKLPFESVNDYKVISTGTLPIPRNFVYKNTMGRFRSISNIPAPTSWYQQVNGSLKRQYSDHIEFKNQSIVFSDGTILKRTNP